MKHVYTYFHKQVEQPFAQFVKWKAFKNKFRCDIGKETAGSTKSEQFLHFDKKTEKALTTAHVYGTFTLSVDN